MKSPVNLRREALAEKRARMEQERARRFARNGGKEPIDFLARLTSAGLCVAGLYGRGVRNACSPLLTHYEFVFESLPESFNGFKILHLSDFHFYDNPDYIAAIERLCSGIETDLTVITGDFPFDDTIPQDFVIECTRRAIAGIQSPHGFLACLGNNDRAELMRPLEDIDVRVQQNTLWPVNKGGQTIYVAGVDDPHRYRSGNVAAAIDSAPAEGFKILMAHSPELANDAAKLGVHLYLCGHTHGGQICLPGGIPIFSNMRASRRYLARPWKLGNMQGFTSRGLGTTAVPCRFFCPPEATVIALSRAQAIE
jgi:predicted MPP superfamily phosphohydrolase